MRRTVLVVARTTVQFSGTRLVGFQQVPQASCLRTMEQKFTNLLTPELDARLVK